MCYKKSARYKILAGSQTKKIGILGGNQRIISDAFLKKLPSDIRPIVQGSSINLFLMNGVEATIIRAYDDIHLLINSGLDAEQMNVFAFSDNSLNFPEDGFYCLEKTLNTKRELIQKFVRASLEGWKMAVENPDSVASCILKFIKDNNYPINIAHIRWSLNAVKKFVFPNSASQQFGILQETDYLNTAKTLLELGLIAAIPPYEQFTIDREN